MSNQLITSFKAQFKREWLINFRARYSLINPLLFFTIVVVLFPLAMNPEPSLLHSVSPGILWSGVILATLLNLDKIFEQDYETGYLDQILLHPLPPSILMMIKIMVFWLITIVPLMVVSPLLAYMLFMPFKEICVFLVGLLLATPIIISLGVVVSALCVSLRSNSVLLVVLLLPLLLPIVILGAGSVVLTSHHLPYLGSLLLLAAGTVVSLTLAPIIAGTALRISQ